MTTIFRRMILIATLIAGPASAGEFQDLDAVDARAAAVVGAPVQTVDRRLKLAACPEALQADTPVSGAVIIRCNARGWRIHVLISTRDAAARPAPIIIKRGDPVGVNFVASGFSVTTSGIAESDARKGEPVRVRVEQKANPVMGEAVDAGTVRVGALN